MNQASEKRYPYFGAPPPKVPRPAVDEPALRGKRVILSLPDGFTYDMRAASETYTKHDGSQQVDIVTEEDWYRWMFTGREPERRPFPMDLVWVE